MTHINIYLQMWQHDPSFRDKSRVSETWHIDRLSPPASVDEALRWQATGVSWQ